VAIGKISIDTAIAELLVYRLDALPATQPTIVNALKAMALKFLNKSITNQPI